MTPRERFRAVMQFEPVDRLPAIENYWWWDQTLDRWYGEGLPRELREHSEIARFLGLDVHHIFWVSPCSRIPVLEGRDRDAGLIRDPAEYEDLVLPLLRGPIEFDREQLRRWAEEQERGDAFLWLQIDGFFWFPRELLGIRPHLLAFYDVPEFLHRINTDLAAYLERVVEEVCAVCRPDVVSIAEDISYNHGCMISRDCFDEFLTPYYRRIVPVLKECGMIVLVDSDGNIMDMVDWFTDAGIDGLVPLERRAGNDPVELRRRHPRLRMMGGFDKTVMHRGETAMREEFERLLPAMRSGGYVAAVDHQTPPEVSLADYRIYVRLLREYAERAARQGEEA